MQNESVKKEVIYVQGGSQKELRRNNQARPENSIVITQWYKKIDLLQKHYNSYFQNIFLHNCKYLLSKNLWNFFRSQTVSLVQCATLQKSIETPLCSNGYAECCFQSFATQGYSITTVIPIHSIHKARKQGLYKKKVDNWHNFCT